MSDSQRKQYPTRGVINRPQSLTLTTTSVSADQEVGSRTPPDGKKLCVQVVIIEVYLTTLSATAVYLGTISVRWNGVVIFGPFQAVNPSSSALFGLVIPIPEEYVLEGDGAKKIDVVCTPATVTSTKWLANITGYERD